MRSKVLFVSLSAVIGLSTVFACSSTTTETPAPATPVEGGAKEGGEAGTGKDTGTSTETDSSTTTDPDKACGAETTASACATCCGPTNHPTGYKLFVDSLSECGCKGTGADGGAPCATDCATEFCATPPKQPTAACNTCLQGSINNGACADHVMTKCAASTDCQAQQKCVAQCQNKPNQ